MMIRILFLLISAISFSQTNGTAIYKLQIAFDQDALDVDKKYGYLQKAIDVCDKLEYKLIFNGNEANFYQEKNEGLDKTAVNMANILSETPKLCYQNTEKKMLLNEINADGNLIKANEFVISDTLKTNWTITNESKLIDTYLCYKATTIKKVQKGEKEFHENVTAWFCPALPFSFGPTKYGGLPGLIIELQEKNIAFTLKSISLNNENKTPIIIPVAKNTISQSDYNKIVNERMESLQSMIKQK